MASSVSFVLILNIKEEGDLEIAGLEAIWIEIFVVRSRSILVCFSYKPPDSSNHIEKTLRQNFET